MSASLALVRVDAFTSEPFSGNPAAVVFLPSPDSVDDAVMQKVAAEMKLSETAFVAPASGAFGDAEVRP